MERDANWPVDGLILRIRGQRQAIEDVESLRTLQPVDEAHNSAIVACDSGFDADFGHAAIGDLFGMGREGIDLQIGLLRDFVKLGSDGRRARTLDGSDFSNFSQSLRVRGMLSLMD